jgi:hypothetical protein
MDKGKHATILLIAILTASSIIMVEAASGTTKPAVPEFTVQFVDNSYDVPTTYTTDPYTGQQITNQGYRVENKCIVVKIKNQQFQPFKNEYEQTIDLYYNIRIKGHYEENWTVLYSPVYGIPKQSADSDYTVFSYTWNEQGDTWLGSWYITLRYGAKADFQVQAMIGRIADPGPFSAEVFEGELSDWSSTQTIAIGEIAPTVTPTNQPVQSTPAPTQTATPDQAVTQDKVLFGLDWKDVAVALLVVVVAGLAFALAWSRLKKR